MKPNLTLISEERTRRPRFFFYQIVQKLNNYPYILIHTEKQKEKKTILIGKSRKTTEVEFTRYKKGCLFQFIAINFFLHFIKSSWF